MSMSIENSNELLDTRETARFLRTTPGVLAVSRCKRRDHPPYLKLNRRILYRKSDLLAWLEKHLVTHPARCVMSDALPHKQELRK